MKRERKRKNGTTRISSKISTRPTVPRLTDEFITIADYIRETMEVEYAIEIDNANRVNDNPSNRMNIFCDRCDSILN